MKPKFDLLVCAIVVATLWGGTANAQVSLQGSGVFGGKPTSPEKICPDGMQT